MFQSFNKVAIPLIMILFLASACKKQNADQLPIALEWDRDTCQECGMVISDHRYAAQVIRVDGKGFVFDDIGCAVNWLKDQPWKATARVWVSDFKTERWIEASKANWRFGDPNTPMGYGFMATMSPVEDKLNFEQVVHRIETNQTFRHQHTQMHGAHGHHMPKEPIPTQMPNWGSKPQTSVESNNEAASMTTMKHDDHTSTSMKH